MLKIPFDESVNFFVDSGASGSRRVPNPDVNELVNIQASNLVMSLFLVNVNPPMVILLAH
jgi:hypothetical protein